MVGSVHANVTRHGQPGLLVPRELSGARGLRVRIFWVADPVVAMADEPIVARDRERARVVDLLDQTRSGRGRLVIISGEAGIGKTCLAGAVAAAAADKGFAVVWARSADRASSAPYGLWRIALQQLPIDRGRERDDLPGRDAWSVASSADRTARRRSVGRRLTTHGGSPCPTM